MTRRPFSGHRYFDDMFGLECFRLTSDPTVAEDREATNNAPLQAGVRGGGDGCGETDVRRVRFAVESRDVR